MKTIDFTTDSLKSGEYEENGFRRVFLSKMWVVYRTLIQGSDLDMKHLNIRSLNGVKVRLTALLKMAFVSHLSRTFFGEFVDKVMAEMCWFGTSIVKRFDGTVDTVDLRNYITEPNIQDPQQRRHGEMCYYSYDQMMSHREDWKDNWDAVEEVWAKMQTQGESRFKVLEFWTWGKVKDNKMHKICIKYLDNTITEKDEFHDVDDWVPYIELERFVTPYRNKRTSKRMAKRLGEYEEMFPYEQFDLFKVFGRSIGMGCGELLSGVQRVYNEMFNQKRKLDLKALLGITVHNAVQGTNGLTELAQDFIANLDQGAVVSLSPGETLTQLQVDTKDADFDLMENNIYELMRQIIGITAQGTGEETPASTSATQASINQQTANTVYDFTRERMHHGLKRLFNNGYAEDVIDELDEKELVAIIGDPTQLQEFDKDLVDNAVNKWALDTKNATGLYPSPEEIVQVRDGIAMDLQKNGDMRFPEIKKSLIKDMELLIEFEMQQEAFDYKLRSDALLAIKNDPTSTKSKAKIEDELLALQGLNPRQYDKTPEELAREQAMQQEQLMAESGQMAAPAPAM